MAEVGRVAYLESNRLPEGIEPDPRFDAAPAAVVVHVVASIAFAAVLAGTMLSTLVLVSPAAGATRRRTGA